MDCRLQNKKLTDYLGGLLSESETAAFEAHLRTCPDCQPLFLADDAELDALLAADWYAAEPDVDMVSRVMDRLPRHHSPMRTKVAAMLLAWAGYLAAWLAVAAMFGYTNVYYRLYHLAIQVSGGLSFLLSTLRSLGNVFTLLTPTPVAVGLLLITLAILIYGLYRLEKEDNLV